MGQRRTFHPAGVRTCKAASKCAERIPGILLLGPGGLVWCWVPGREGRGAGGESAADSAADTSSDLYLFLQP